MNEWITPILLRILLVLGLGQQAYAGGDHGPTAPTLNETPVIGFELVGERVELVGQLTADGHHLKLFLDHVATNQPVAKATFNLQVGKQIYPVQMSAGQAEIALTQDLSDGTYSLLANIALPAEGGAAQQDLLAGEWVVHHEHGAADPTWIARLKRIVKALFSWRGGLAMMVLIGIAIWQRQRLMAAWSMRGRKRNQLSQWAMIAVLGGIAATALPQPSWAHGDHDAPAVLSVNGPRRLPNGEIAIPKVSQHEIGLRTQVVHAGQAQQTLTLNAKVVMDPNAGGRVQAMLGGRVQPGPQGLPNLGQAVKVGQVLGYVIPAAGQLERASQQAQVAELQAAEALAKKRLARLQALVDSVPRSDIEAVQSELESLAGRIHALQAGLKQRDPLLAPVSGVIASANVVAGQVVEPNQILFEIVQPARMRIEALTYDPALATQIHQATMSIGVADVALTLVGSGKQVNGQALPLLFTPSVPSTALQALALGQLLPVQVALSTQVSGFVLTQSALVKNPANQTIVWVKVGPQQYRPQVVQTMPLSRNTVLITQGLQAGERVAIEGVSLLNQIR